MDDIVARYTLTFKDLASKGIRGVSAAAGSLVGQLGLAVAAGAAFRSAMDFQTILTDIEQKAENGAAAVAGLSDKLYKAAAAAGALPVDAAKAYDALLGMGASSKLADSLIQPVLNAATAYRALPDEVAKAAFSLESGLKLSGLEAAKAIDILAVAAKMGKVELRDMAGSIPSLAAQFGTLGGRGLKGVSQIAAGLEVVAKAAGNAEEGATNFRNLLSKIDSRKLAIVSKS